MSLFTLEEITVQSFITASLPDPPDPDESEDDCEIPCGTGTSCQEVSEACGTTGDDDDDDEDDDDDDQGEDDDD